MMKFFMSIYTISVLLFFPHEDRQLSSVDIVVQMTIIPNFFLFSIVHNKRYRNTTKLVYNSDIIDIKKTQFRNKKNNKMYHIKLCSQYMLKHAQRTKFATNISMYTEISGFYFI